jgi:hypothetical protein
VSDVDDGSELTVPYFPLAAALGRALDHESLEFWEVVVELSRAFPQFDWKNAMTDGASRGGIGR